MQEVNEADLTGFWNHQINLLLMKMPYIHCVFSYLFYTIVQIINLLTNFSGKRQNSDCLWWPIHSSILYEDIFSRIYLIYVFGVLSFGHKTQHTDNDWLCTAVQLPVTCISMYSYNHKSLFKLENLYLLMNN